MTFDEWAILGKDEGMERGHHNSVEHMFKIILNTKKHDYSIIDFGCGNGWVVRKFKEHSACIAAHGLDGAKNMIKKAQKYDPQGTYFNEDILIWKSSQKYDFVFSMETLYYFENPGIIINKIYDDVLNENGMFIIGIDHYSENTPSLSWEKDIGIKTKTMSVIEWIDKVKSHGFKNIKYLTWGKKNDWNGTLIISAFK